MQTLDRNRTFDSVAVDLGLPIAVTVLLYAVSPNDPSLMACGVSYCLLAPAWLGYRRWRSMSQAMSFPLCPLVTFAYWVAFGLPLFLGGRNIFLYGRGEVSVDEHFVTQTMLLVGLGVTALWVGARFGQDIWRSRVQFQLRDESATWTYVRTVMLLGGALSLLPGAVFAFGSDARQILNVLATIVPRTAFLVLLQRHLQRRSTGADRYAGAAYVAMEVIGTLGSGSIGASVNLAAASTALIVLRRTRVPWRLIFLVVAAVAFLQLGKGEFRNRFWGGSDAGVFEKIEYWYGASSERWTESLSNETDETTSGLLNPTVERLSLLPQVSHVLDLTPNVIPLQYGRTYYYMMVTLIPRVLWPSKPSVSEANRFYQVTYGLSSETDLASTSISVGVVAEAFMNFGWAGVALVMFLVGLGLAVFELSFLRPGSGDLMLGMGLAVLPELLAVESQLAVYMGGLVQELLLTGLVFSVMAGRPAVLSAMRRSGGWRPGVVGR